MNFHNKNNLKSLTLEEKEKRDKNLFRRKHNKFPKSQTSSNIHSHELFHKKFPLKNIMNNNSSKSTSQYNELLYDEEINYNIDSTKPVHDTTYCTNLQKDNKKFDTNLLSNEEILDKNIVQKDYWLEEKNSYIKQLEKKIKKQNNIINGLLNNENSSNSKNLNNNDKSNNNSFMDYNYENKKMFKKLNQKNQKSKTFIEENNNSNNDISINNTFNSYMNNNNSNNKYISNSNTSKTNNDKYDSLYSKYLNLFNDFKYLNNNKNNEKSLNKLKTKYNSLLEENNNLKSKLKSKNKLIKNQQKEIEKMKSINAKRLNISNNNQDKELIKELQEQCETLRKDLVLSQAMVNSLKTEIDFLKKSNSNSIEKNGGGKKKILTGIDKYNFTFNDNASVSPKNNLEQSINLNNNDYSKMDLVNSLNNKNKLLTKVLQENNLLRNRLKKFDSFLPNFIDVYDNEEFEELNKEQLRENLIKKYEEKFQYFSSYVKRIKIIINDIFKDIPFTLNKYLNKNYVLSEKFILGLYDLRKEYYTIKNIDEFNLDVTDDEKCIKIYANLIKLFNKELELYTMNNNNNNNNISLNMSNNLKNDFSTLNQDNNYFGNTDRINYKYREKEGKNENDNDINFIKGYNNKKFNLTDLNIGRIEEEKTFNSNEVSNKILNNRKITYVTDYGNKKPNNHSKSINFNFNREYFFDYGANSNNNINFNKEL